jgi:hypothetical protein
MFVGDDEKLLLGSKIRFRMLQEKVKAQREQYYREREDGFHQFSQADASEVIDTLQAIKKSIDR